uniref:Ribosomal protein L20 n=1 Tax=Renouxia sp. TaxID=2485823 RepID=A0A3G3MIF6_9FLOR|nr:ribosomal protein L20 [Renouxia sp.]
MNRKIWIKRMKILNHISSIKFKLLIYFFSKQNIKLNKKIISTIVFEEKTILFILNYWLFCFYYRFY